jgi:hypothetical protein
MKKIIAIAFTAVFVYTAQGQTADSTVAAGKVNVVKDARLDILAKKQAEFNKTTVGLGAKAAKGYRLMVLNSNDRTYAMRVRSQLLQNFPEHKVYMTYQAPFIKLKFGNFIEKGEADRYKRIISGARIVTTNIYLVPEIVEVKPDKDKDDDDK